LHHLPFLTPSPPCVRNELRVRGIQRGVRTGTPPFRPGGCRPPDPPRRMLVSPGTFQGPCGRAILEKSPGVAGPQPSPPPTLSPPQRMRIGQRLRGLPPPDPRAPWSAPQQISSQCTTFRDPCGRAILEKSPGVACPQPSPPPALSPPLAGLVGEGGQRMRIGQRLRGLPPPDPRAPWSAPQQISSQCTTFRDPCGRAILEKSPGVACPQPSPPPPLLSPPLAGLVCA